MTLGTLMIALTSITLATAGQLLLKAGMGQVGADLSLADFAGLLPRVLTNGLVLAGLASFGVSAVFWLVTLSRVPLSTAYPMVSLTYVLIVAWSALVLGERPGFLTWGGTALIVGGISLVGLGVR